MIASLRLAAAPALAALLFGIGSVPAQEHALFGRPQAGPHGEGRPDRPSRPKAHAPAEPARHGRDTQSLDGTWHFQTDPDNRGESAGWMRALPASAKETLVPSLWNKQDAPNYSGVAWYWREFDTPAAWKGQTVRLLFGAVAEKAQVWLNSQLLGEHADGATPFEFNVTRAIHIGEKNTLAVRVEGTAQAGAGIRQSVLLLAHDEAYIADVFAQATGLGHLNAVVAFLNTSEHSGDAELDGRLVAANAPTRDIQRANQNLRLTPGRNLTTLLFTVSGSRLQRWSPMLPFLYRLQLVFRQDKDILDTQETTFGFREFGFKDGAITLNGEPLQPAAVAPPSAQPLVLASAEDRERARDSLRHARDKGINIVYLAAPPSALLDVADEEGMLVVEGPRPHQTPKAAADELRALLLRDRSHPCVLAWDLRAADADTASLVRQLDSSRFLLVGPAVSPRLWLPGQNAASAVTPPSGFLPTS